MNRNLYSWKRNRAENNPDWITGPVAIMALLSKKIPTVDLQDPSKTTSSFVVVSSNGLALISLIWLSWAYSLRRF